LEPSNTIRISSSAALGQRVGITREHLEALPDFETSPLFSELDRLVLRYAEPMTVRVQVDGPLVEALRGHLSPEVLVQLTLSIAAANFTNRLRFKDVKVLTTAGEVAPERPMTVQDLLRHTAGLPYGELTQNAAVKDALAKAGLFKPGVIEFDVRDMTGAEQVERLARIPLLYQPGTTWEYSLASDVLGRVVEAASGKRLGDFLSERLFKPLGMNDTAFWVPEAKLGRLAEPFEKDPLAGTAIRLIDVAKPPGNDSGGAGGVATAGDYLRFAQMLANGGILDGQRVLSRTTIKHMTADHLGSSLPLAATPGGGVLRASTYTFGLGFAVRPSDGIAPVPGSAGDFNWGGYAGTVFWVDPKEELVAVFMVQSAGALRLYHRTLFRQLVYQAIVD
jgi:CubicO group peptidase (beta-lactamase class C family)